MTQLPLQHWHVAHGLTGYGPDASDSDGFATFDEIRAVSDHVRDELSTDVDHAIETAHALAESGDFEGAWNEYLRSGSLENLRANLSNERANAPLYAGNPEAWNASLLDLLESQFPVDVSDNTRLYVWQCEESDCGSDDA